MSKCPACSHGRLLHDSWGCKEKGCCGVSIVYLTELWANTTDLDAELAALDMGKALVAESDRVSESHIRALAARAQGETTSYGG